jgi:hypothetical protein
MPESRIKIERGKECGGEVCFLSLLNFAQLKIKHIISCALGKREIKCIISGALWKGDYSSSPEFCNVPR